MIEQALMLPEWIDQTIILAAAGCRLSWRHPGCSSGAHGLVADDQDFSHLRDSEIQRELATRIANEVYRRLAEEKQQTVTRS